MGNVTVIAIIVGVMLFGLLAVIVFLEEKVPLFKDSKIFNVVKEAVIALMLLCVPVVIVSVLVHWANQPSGYEVCMEGMNGQTDDAAIAWMEEYCSSNR